MIIDIPLRALARSVVRTQSGTTRHIALHSEHISLARIFSTMDSILITIMIIIYTQKGTRNDTLQMISKRNLISKVRETKKRNKEK